MLIIEIIGWIGSIMYLVAYFLLSNKIIEKDKLYYLLNIVAAVLVAILSTYKNTMQSVFLNLFWGYLSYFAYINKEFKFNIISVRLFNISISALLIVSFILLLLKKQFLALDTLAWISVFVFIVSYYLLLVNKISLQSFNIYNFIAAFIIIPKMYTFENYQVAFVQAIWAFFALKAYVEDLNLITIKK